MVAAASPDSLHVSLAPAARLAPEGAATELGQADFDGGESNRGSGDASASTLFWPYCVAWDGANLCVADAGNNRLMLWHQAPRAHNTSCDVLVGQAGSQLVEHNQGSYYPDAACLNMPYGGAVMGQLPVVADTANSRLLAWRIDQLTRHGVIAVALAAQADWNAKGDNRWRPAARDSVCWPYSVAVQQPCTLLVADSGNNRVLMWPLAPGL